MSLMSLYAAMGKREGCHRLSVAFYSRVERDPLLRPLFPGTTFTCAIAEFSAFLAQFLGGPSEDSQRRWWLSLGESHQRFKIGAKERAAWMSNMAGALEDVRMGEPIRSQLLSFFEQASAHVVNQGEATARPGVTHPEIDRRWEAQTTLDEAVTAIRRGDASRAIELANSLALQMYSRSVTCGLLGLMLRCRSDAKVEYVRMRLISDPALVHERHAGRTLLHEAAAVGDLSSVELLLSLGADPDAKSGGGHTPLYCAGNECGVEGAGKVVRALVKGGAGVNAHDGVQRCTPLHMAARRGNAEVAGALIDCGADIKARDRTGDTPLRRAVNCDKVAVARLLLNNGAEPDSIGSKGLTPRLAARSAAMKRLLQDAGR